METRKWLSLLPAWDKVPRLESLIAEHDELLNAVVDQPVAGQHFMAIKMRMPYQSAPEVVLIDLDALSAKSAAALLSAHSSANTATTTAFVGLVNKLSAIALAVRSRSYELIAHCSSKAGALLRCIDCKRVSNSSVKSMGAPLVDGKVESPHRTAKRSTRPLALLAAALAALTLTACGGGDHEPSGLVSSIAANAAAATPTPVVIGSADRACRDAAGNDVVCP